MFDKLPRVIICHRNIIRRHENSDIFWPPLVGHKKLGLGIARTKSLTP